MKGVKRSKKMCILLALLVVLCAAGCSDGKVAVRGSVAYDGTPVEDGMITFEPTDGKSQSTGGMIVNGTYDLPRVKGASPGEHLVRIVALRKTGRKIPAGSPAPPGEMVDEVIQCIPAEFNDRTSLKVQITAGKANRHDFDLKPPRKGP